MRITRPPRGSSWGGPQIPKGLLHDCYSIDTVKEFKQDEGGVYKATDTVTATFKGTVMPLNNEDLQMLPDGTSTTNSKKIYTNGFELRPGQRVRDGYDNQDYTVLTELTHGPVHSMKRYVVNRKGAASNR